MPLFSADARLSDLSVAPRDIIGFDPARTTAYQVGVGPNVGEATVIATANDAGASVSITGSADADPDTDGHQVSLSAGRNGLTVKVTAEDGTVVRNYEVRVNRGVTNLGGWHAGADFDGLIAAGNTKPRGVWSDGTTMWVANEANDKVYAYRMSDGTHDAARDITLATVNNWPTGIWSDGTTMWVADFVADKVFAYKVSGGARDADKDIDTLGAAGNLAPRGLWSDETTMWVADGTDAKVYAYALSGGARDADKDIDTLGAAGNGNPQGLWSDETTMWVADGTDAKVYAYALSGGARDADKDIDTRRAAGNRNPRGLWSDGTTMWVADYDNDKVYAYNLAALPVPGVGECNVSASDCFERQLELPEREDSLDLSGLTLTEEVVEPWIQVATGVSGVDTDGDGVDDAIGFQGFEFVKPRLVVEGDVWEPSGIWGDPDLVWGDADAGEVGLVWVVDPLSFGIHPFKWKPFKNGELERLEDSAVDPADTSGVDYRFGYGCHFRRGVVNGDGNPGPSVMWGDAETVWVANSWAGTFDAYSRDADVEGSDVEGSTGYGCYEERVTAWTDDGSSYTTERNFYRSYFEHDATKSWDVGPGGPDAYWGVWSDGDKVWVAGPGGPRAGVYVFDPDSKTVVEAEGFDGVGGSNGLWSDGQAMWVATAGLLKAYWLDGGVRLADLDVVLRRPWAAPAGIWSNGEYVWVTYRDGVIDQYRLPGGEARALAARALEGVPLTAQVVSAPSFHDGASAFYVRVAFSEAVEMSGEDMIAAVVSAGGAVTAASPVGNGGDVWDLVVEPAGAGAVSLLVPPGGACAVGAVCTPDGRPLSVGVVVKVPGPAQGAAAPDDAEGPPGVPDQPWAAAVFEGGVDLGWVAMPGANRYEVQAWLGGQWAVLPSGSTQIAFYGAGAVISGLDPSSSLWAQVRAVNGHGASEWSQMRYLTATREFTEGRRPRPANTPATGAPAIVGDPAARALWADTSDIVDADGLDRVLYRYQWTDDGKDIADATHITYAWDAADAAEDREIGVRVSFTDRLGNSETLTSAPVTATAVPRPSKTHPTPTPRPPAPSR